MFSVKVNPLFSPCSFSFTGKRLKSTVTDKLFYKYDPTNIKHMSRNELLAYNKRDKRVFKNRFVKPFNRFDQYEDIVKYTEWSYHHTGLTMQDHIENINLLKEILSYRMFNSLLKLYQQRFVIIPNKYAFNVYDKRSLVKPEKLLVSLITRRYMTPKALFASKSFLSTEADMKHNIDFHYENNEGNLQNEVLKKINTMFTALSEEEKAVYGAEAKKYDAILSKILQIDNLHNELTKDEKDDDEELE
ncbi:hypothetical protein QEN19_004038 [Hanseniaspora menglaensis]